MAEEFKPWEETLPPTGYPQGDVVQNTVPSGSASSGGSLDSPNISQSTSVLPTATSQTSSSMMSDEVFNEKIRNFLLNNPILLRVGTNNQADTIDVNSLVNTYHFEMFLSLASAGGNVGSTGYSDATVKLLSIATHESNTDKINIAKFSISTDFGSPLYLLDRSGPLGASSLGAGGSIHPLSIGSDYWSASITDTAIFKNGTSVTISGTGRFGSLGHDPTNSYLLVMYSTTKIAKFSGISGTTITNVSADVTLDTAIVQVSGNFVGFVFDNLNRHYVLIDTTNHLLRKFDSQGKTLQIVKYTFTDTSALGVFLIGNRYYVAIISAQALTNLGAQLTVSLVPTTMERG